LGIAPFYQAQFEPMHPQRRIKSFVLRAGRVTAAQERALVKLWPLYGLDFTGDRLDLDAAFGRTEVPRCLDIGFGAGEVIGTLAKANPLIDYLGIEVHRAGVGRLLLHVAAAKLENVRLVCHDAVEVIVTGIDAESFDEILVFFPDPWHKKRHRKRRLIDTAFIALLASKLRRGGVLRLATDWQDYAEQMLSVCNACTQLESLSPTGDYVERPAARPSSRYERRGMRLGHAVWDLGFRRREK